jgi:hypothetical protein
MASDQAKGCGALIVIVVLIYAAGKCAGSGSQDAASSTGTAPPAVMSAEDEKAADARGKACEKALGDLAANGLIRDRPEANRADVEEATWDMLPAKEKRMVAAGVRCAFLRGRESDKFDDYAVVYGYRSGKRLAMATANGVSVEGAD